MANFVDPRSNPEPPATVSREPSADPDELREFVRICYAGRIYDVEGWIREGRPIQALTYKRPGKPTVISPLRTAIRKNNRDVVLLLLCNGYRQDLEPKDPRSLLDEALSIHAFEILELLLRWGADPLTASVEDVIDTYKTDLIERFWKAGLDYTKDSRFVFYLAGTPNKPLYGWLRRNRSQTGLQDALDVALQEAVTENKEKVAHLLVWAGADPHRKVHSARDWGYPEAWDPEGLMSAAEAAILYGREHLFDVLRVQTMPDLERQEARAHDSSILKRLVALRPPSDWSEIIRHFIWDFCCFEPGSWSARDAFKFIESAGGRLTRLPPEEVRNVRSQLLNLPFSEDFLWLMKWLKKPKNCDPDIYEELTRTGGFRKRLKALEAGEKYLTPSQKMSKANERRQRAREKAAAKAAGEVAKKDETGEPS